MFTVFVFKVAGVGASVIRRRATRTEEWSSSKTVITASRARRSVARSWNNVLRGERSAGARLYFYWTHRTKRPSKARDTRWDAAMIGTHVL